MEAIFPELPLIDKMFKTFEELSVRLGDQNDHIFEAFSDLREKFTGHYMTRMSKQLKQENEQLKQLNTELVPGDFIFCRNNLSMPTPNARDLKKKWPTSVKTTSFP